MMLHTWTRALLTLVLVVASGCAQTPKAAASDDYISLFNSGRYSDAYEASSKAAGSLRGSNRELAALIAGQSAYRLGRPTESERWLKPLLDSSDRAVAGRAAATLGSLARDRGENRPAFELFDTAASKLMGDDAARALMYAGDAKHALGDKSVARDLWTRAQSKVESDVQLRVQIGDRLAGAYPGSTPAPTTGAYTVQAGAFASRATADALAQKLRSRGPTRVVLLTKDGKTLHAVRIGSYATRAEADRVRAAVGSGAIVTRE
ncbi:MAG: SPOR domain-containing protein [Phycisphaerales bacterium]